jgi:hypothetical protein
VELIERKESGKLHKSGKQKRRWRKKRVLDKEWRERKREKERSTVKYIMKLINKI